MMHLYGALILLVTVSAACGLKCYKCEDKTCTTKLTCPAGEDRCSTNDVKGVITKGCMKSASCVDPIKCCNTDLCNSDTPTGSSDTPTGSSATPTGSSATPTGSSVLLLLASSAIITLFF